MATTLTIPKNNETPEFNVRSLFPVERVDFTPEELKEINDTFPPVNPGFIPNGNRVLVQLRSLSETTKGGIILSQQSQEAALYEEQIGRVVAVGASAFFSQATMQPWPEGEWFSIGDFVRVPKFGGDKTWTKNEDKKTLFVIFRDFDIIGKVIGNPLNIKGYI